MDTFKREISLTQRKLNEKGIPTGELEKVSKSATFKELSQFDEEQGELIFSLSALIQSSSENDFQKTVIDPKMMYRITKEIVKYLLVPGEGFTEDDKKLFLLDSVALLKFGNWFISEKFIGFFLTTMKS
jgi:hypothetical protein